MGRPKGSKNKNTDPFSDLDGDWKDAAAGSSREEVQQRIAAVALNDVELRRLKKEDQHLKECQEAYKDASARYRDGFKQNKLKIEFLKRVLDDKGGPTKAVENVSTDNSDLN